MLVLHLWCYWYAIHRSAALWSTDEELTRMSQTVNVIAPTKSLMVNTGISAQERSIFNPAFVTDLAKRIRAKGMQVNFQARSQGVVIELGLTALSLQQLDGGLSFAGDLVCLRSAVYSTLNWQGSCSMCKSMTIHNALPLSGGLCAHAGTYLDSA